jgi:5-methylcytosine-specific restriction protein B
MEIDKFLDYYNTFKRVAGQKYNKENTKLKKDMQKFRKILGEFTDKIFLKYNLELVNKGQWQNSGNHSQYLWNRYKLKTDINTNLVIYFNVSAKDGMFISIGLVDDKINNIEKKYYNEIYNFLDKECKNIFCNGFIHHKTSWNNGNRIFKIENEKNIEQADYDCLIPKLIEVYKKTLKKFYKKEDLEETVKNNTYPLNQILYGPPGTGKTYKTISKALEIIFEKEDENKIIEFEFQDNELKKSVKELNDILNRKDITKEDRKELKIAFEYYRKEKQIEFITFHQSYAYEEFIEGIKPKSGKCSENSDDKNNEIEYCIKDGIFKKIVKNALNNKDKNYVLIIDEINRGNISKIFGELITLIEASKRVGADEELKVRLPYSNEKAFGVPQNLYIIGTMNTADRSIAHIDTALRRRFKFIEMMPDYELLDFEVYGIKIDKMLKAINERIEVLYDREHQIGHSYFLSLKDNENSINKLDKLVDIFENQIIPLLAEYFYSDWSKILLVLNDNGFVKGEEKEAGGFKKKIYKVEVTKDIEKFKKIYNSSDEENTES